MNEFFMHSKKFDGSPHYRYPVRVIERSDDRLGTYLQKGTAIESYRGLWNTKRHILGFFWLNQPFVLHVIWEGKWEPKMLYVDIATQTSWNDAAVRYVDMDLDVFLKHDFVQLDDEDEFEEHCLLWNYPPQLVKKCHDSVEQVRQLFECRQPPFTLEMFNWRPGTPLNF
jgi:protein associated with RNAse G/E